MKIAYVEDDHDSRLVFSQRFRADRIACDAFASAEEALPVLTTSSYDALVLDIRLSGMSGVELLERLRHASIHVPCVLITAFSNLGLMKQAVNAGASYLLEKPFKYADLKRILEKVTEPPASLQHFVDRSLERLELTPRELDVARLLLKGLSNREIATTADLSEKTVKQYLTQVFEKAGVKSRAEFFSYVFPV